MNEYFKNKTFVILSKWSYPFGGGEGFLYQTMEWATRLKMNVYWLCFTDAKNNSFNQLTIDNYDCGKIIKIPGGLNELNLINWLKILKPDLIHHQGHERMFFYKICRKLRLTLISGFHFWTGAIILNEQYGNIQILENADQHKKNEEIDILMNDPKFCHLYTVTKFVAECIEKITGYNIEDNIYASSSYEQLKISNFDSINNKYVSVINIHKLKGGELLIKLIKKMPEINFICVYSEYGCEDIVEEIKKITQNNYRLISRVDDVRVILQETKIFLAPSIVDETFCRTVNEAMINGIPVLTTGRGNIKYMVGNGKYGKIIDIDDVDGYVNEITKLMTDNTYYRQQKLLTLEGYELFSEKKAEEQFMEVSYKVMMKSKDRNIMIISPWCDQGLGIQSRNYYRILKRNNFNVFVFALKPYIADTCIELQRDPDEWITDHIYYSPNDREHVKDKELNDFINQYNIGKCIIPETCWFRIFEIAKFMKSNDIKCYAIPNIEIVRKDELYKHRFFYKILCNNRLCENIFNDYDITNTEYVGYGVEDKITPNKIKNKKLKCLFIGGMNAFSRKHILTICEAFTIIKQKNKNICLTCTVQKINELELETVEKIQNYINDESINIIQKHLSYQDILNLYNEHDISIQVSKHEGLGLGFYEALMSETPIITLDTPPHNEIVKEGINGWVLPCYYKKMTDNKDPIFDSAYFNASDLANKILEIYESKDVLLPKLRESLSKDFKERLDISIFEQKFIKSLN